MTHLFAFYMDGSLFSTMDPTRPYSDPEKEEKRILELSNDVEVISFIGSTFGIAWALFDNHEERKLLPHS